MLYDTYQPLTKEEAFMLTLTRTRTRPVYYPVNTRSPLSGMETFKNVPAEALREIEKQMVEKKYAKRESIFLEDDRAEFVWFVKEGHVKEVHHAADGRSNTLCLVGANGMFGVSAFEGGNYGFHSVAKTDTTVFSFPIRAFQALMGKYPQMGGSVVSQISKLLRHSKDMQAFSQESAQKRLLHTLVEMVGEFGRTVPLTRKEIAEM